MSVMGTGIAAGVAQAASNAEQVARRRDKRTNKTAEETRRIREIFEAHFKTLEEHDETENAARIYTDSQVPQHERHDEPVTAKQRKEAGEESEPITRRAQAASAYAAADAAADAVDNVKSQAQAQAHANAFDLLVNPDTGHATAQVRSHIDVQG